MSPVFRKSNDKCTCEHEQRSKEEHKLQKWTLVKNTIVVLRGHRHKAVSQLTAVGAKNSPDRPPIVA
jgi:hypothetical protein